MRMRSIEQKKVLKDVGFLLCCSLQQAAWCIVRRCTDIPYENAEHKDACAACLCLVSVAALSSNKRKIKKHTSKIFKIQSSTVWEGCSWNIPGEILFYESDTNLEGAVF